MTSPVREEKRDISFNRCGPCNQGQHLGQDHEGRYCECPCRSEAS